ncbi:TetR/AcrR family transcriptional regulator C-terminal ligand-binding domain-containing protein [Nonomuraea sp. NPDC050202]|uniref:TetR/AcrR family transcriptional regulator C-terminal ligand-binding domain-containing protein n=1 Tax=Nonomuraea sp. NPDC050202 TaxID=3155035 RepID=UPI0033C71D49
MRAWSCAYGRRPVRLQTAADLDAAGAARPGVRGGLPRPVPRRAAAARPAAVERAVARGELPRRSRRGGRDRSARGALYYRVLVTDEPIGRAYTDRLADDFLRRVVSGRATPG